MCGCGAGETGGNRFCGGSQLRRCGSTEGGEPSVAGCRGCLLYTSFEATLTDRQIDMLQELGYLPVIMRQYGEECANCPYTPVSYTHLARNRMELIVRSLAEQNGVTEQLKAEIQMEWVRQMNACKAQAEEVVKAELIYN